MFWRTPQATPPPPATYILILFAELLRSCYSNISLGLEIST